MVTDVRCDPIIPVLLGNFPRSWEFEGRLGILGFCPCNHTVMNKTRSQAVARMTVRTAGHS